VDISLTPASPKVELRSVNLRYFGLEGETEALKDISLEIAPGEFVAIIGQSGCGKSTLLSLISGILHPTDGAVLLDGKPVTGPSRKVGYMLQQDYLFEWRTILDNAVLGAEIQGIDMRKARDRAAQLLGDLASIERKLTPVVANHSNVQPTFNVRADVQDRDAAKDLLAKEGSPSGGIHKVHQQAHRTQAVASQPVGLGQKLVVIS